MAESYKPDNNEFERVYATAGRVCDRYGYVLKQYALTAGDSDTATGAELATAQSNGWN